MKNNIKKIHRILFVIGLGIIGVSMYFVSRLFSGEEKVTQVCVTSEICFGVEVVDTPASRQQGLMYRESLPERSGMLFVFEASILHVFWMKNTLFPLDIIWIDENFNVRKIMTAQPCIADPCPIYTPGVAAKYVLEINAGMAQKHQITEGTEMKFVNIQ